MDRFVNVAIMRNPWNWVIVLSFVTIGALLLRELGRLVSDGGQVSNKLTAKTISGVNAATGA